MGWETYKRSMKPSPKEPTVTLSKSGIIGLNTAVAKNIIGDSRYALLLFDREKNLLGIKFIAKNEPDAYPVKVIENRTHASLAGVSFMKNYGIYPEKTTVYPASYDEHNKILVVDLSELKGGRKRIKI